MASSTIAELLSSLSRLREPVRVSGLTRGAQSYLLARALAESRESFVLFVPDRDSLDDVADELRLFTKELLGADVPIATFPAWDHIPHSPIAPSLKSRFARMATLNRLVLDDKPRIIVTTLEAALQRTVARDFIEERKLVLKENESVGSRENLIQGLQLLGFQRLDSIQDPGTFSVRGEIVDVFPAGATDPVRIELFDDVIEKIRRFDPDSQRSVPGTEMKSLTLGPAAEVLILPENLTKTRERIKAFCDDLGVSRAVRDPVLEGIYAYSFPDHSDFWASFAYAKTETLLDYCEGFSRVVVDELGCEQAWDLWVEQIKAREPESPFEGILIPPLAQLYDTAYRFGSDPKARLFLDRIEIADLKEIDLSEGPPKGASESELAKEEPKITDRHRVQTRDNSDLAQSGRKTLDDLEPKFQLWIERNYRIVLVTATDSQQERLKHLLQAHHVPLATAPGQTGAVEFIEGTLNEGFRWPAERIVVLSDAEILGTSTSKKKTRAAKARDSALKDWSNLQALTDLNPGDAVVHIDHGIGRYAGLVRLEHGTGASDFLQIEYANKDKLYLPVYRLNVIQKYLGGSGESVVLDKLGGQQFAKEKEKVREAVRKLAVDLVKLYAERQIRPGLKTSPRDNAYREFEARFPFDETPDQLKAIDSSLDDMEAGRVMDRLVCGDVGYGKTEVAIRAAFKMVSDGHQVAVLVPTTVLAHQHEQSFKNRLKEYPIRIDSVSRFKNAKEQKAILQDVKAGKIDIIIGTHRLLSSDVSFQNLGLIIVDEEHRFGVEHKEKLKTLRVNTHVLTLTATPIPRTLHMALSGLREISLITTPPVNRLPIRTYVSKFDEELIQKAVELELNRGGQVFIVHNRVQSIYEIANRVRELVPRAQVVVGHGQMPEKELEEVMIAFYQKKANVLISTTIIESGLDVPSANTMIINRADTFGLAQLYQLRGRVGRSQTRAYAYLLLPAEGAISEDAKKRLEVIQKFVELGSGFQVASHDLEIRGGGDLLGAAQSGHIAAVGFELYTELLEEAIRDLQGKPLSAEDSHREPEIKVPFSAFLSEEFVPDVHQRLNLYRRLSATSKESEIDELEEEMTERFGRLPEEARNLLWLIRVKQMLKVLKVDALTVGPERLVLTPGAQSALDPIRAIALVSSQSKKYSLTPDGKFIAQVKTLSLKDLYFSVQALLKDLSISRTSS